MNSDTQGTAKKKLAKQMEYDYGEGYVYFEDVRDDSKYVYVGHSDKDDKRLNTHENDGKRHLAVLPASLDFERRIHNYFTEQGFLAGFGNSRSIYKGDVIWRYVSKLLSEGYARQSLDDSLHLCRPPWESISPQNILALRDSEIPLCEETSRQITVFAPPKTIDHRNRAKTPLTLVHHRSRFDEWFTPVKIIEAVRRVLGSIDTDPASCPVANDRVRARWYWSQMQSGLELRHAWVGNVFLNPPYNGVAVLFAQRLFREIQSGSVTAAIMLLNLNSMSAKWFYDIPRKANAFLVTNGRLRCAAGTKEQKKNNPGTGSSIFYFGSNTELFYSEFHSMGNVFVEWSKQDRLIKGS